MAKLDEQKSAQDRLRAAAASRVTRGGAARALTDEESAVLREAVARARDEDARAGGWILGVIFLLGAFCMCSCGVGVYMLLSMLP